MTTPRVVVFGVILAAGVINVSLPGQVGWVFRGGTATATPMPVFAPPFPPVPPVPCPFGPMAATMTPAALPAGAAPLGGMAADDSSGVFAFSTGPSITVLAHPAMPPLTPPIPPGAFAVPAAASPASPGGMFGSITGMAYGFVPLFGTILWVTDGRAAMGLSVVPPFSIVRPPFPIAAAPAGSPPISGLEYDVLGTSLWACNMAGECFSIRVFPAGFPAGGGLAAGTTIMGPIMPLVLPAGVVTGCVWDRSSFPPSLWVTDGVTLNMALGPPLPPVALPAGAGTAYGATFFAEPLALASGGVCIGAVPTVGVSRATSWGAGVVPFSVNVTGGFPGAGTLLAADATCVPGGTALAPLGGSGTWWLPLAPAVLIGPFALDAAGAAAFPFVITPDLVGSRILVQAASVCALTGIVAATRAVSITFATP